jgi:hypothetical protein
MATAKTFNHLLGTAMVGAALAVASADVSAITIVRNFLGVGAAPTTAGGGNFQTIFNVAADWWEAAILDAHTVSIAYDWGPQAGGTLAAHSLTTQGGTPNRETAGQIIFDNDGSSNWFLDPTPLQNEEYSTFTPTTQNLGGGVMNVGRVWTGASGNALNNFDLLSTAIHEIGHALGLSSANTAFQAEAGPAGAGRDVDVTAPRQFAGSAIPLENATAHISLPTTLMWPFATSGGRVYISDADILANCQISQFTNCVLDPQLSVPEPGTLGLLAASLGVLGFAARRRRQA